MTPTLRLQRLAAADWAVYRSVRLAALAESPRMFGSDLARERVFAEADWRQRTAGTTVAFCNDEPLGVVGWHWSEPSVRAELVAMWVAPSARGRGVGEALVRDVVDAVVVARGAELHLGVVETNAPALGLYRRLGFTVVGSEIGTLSGDRLMRMRYVGAGEDS